VFKECAAGKNEHIYDPPDCLVRYQFLEVIIKLTMRMFVNDDRESPLSSGLQKSLKDKIAFYNQKNRELVIDIRNSYCQIRKVDWCY
jgi:hypothetical protein